MDHPPETKNGRSTPRASQGALLRALMLERFGGPNSIFAYDVDGHSAEDGILRQPLPRRARRRYRGWTLASGGRR